MRGDNQDGFALPRQRCSRIAPAGVEISPYYVLSYPDWMQISTEAVQAF